jgi:hypothetical protein
MYPGGEQDYYELMESLRETPGPAAENNISFGPISHRFTARTKKTRRYFLPPPCPWKG